MVKYFFFIVNTISEPVLRAQTSSWSRAAGLKLICTLTNVLNMNLLYWIHEIHACLLTWAISSHEWWLWRWEVQHPLIKWRRARTLSVRSAMCGQWTKILGRQRHTRPPGRDVGINPTGGQGPPVDARLRCRLRWGRAPACCSGMGTGETLKVETAERVSLSPAGGAHGDLQVAARLAAAQGGRVERESGVDGEEIRCVIKKTSCYQITPNYQPLDLLYTLYYI